jgi:dipeptidyl aminopeptidase/acylaminoacyl peptidase
VTRRWTEQRWLIDNIIRSVGIDWDQPRSINYNAPCGPEANADFAGIRERVKKYADISPAFETAARRREARARAAEEAEEQVTARQNYFIAAVQYAAAQWPYDENNDRNLSLNQRKRECYLNYAKYADRKVEAAWIPFQGKALPGWLHLPPGYSGGRIPAVVAIPGMDGFKEASVAMYGDRWLTRGIAVLSVEGPGQYESAVLGIPVSMPNWVEAGRAIMDWMAARPEIDAQRVGVIGQSFGSLFATIACASEPRYRACAVTATCLEPGCHTIFEEASPTFKQRFMYMSGYTDEAAFDEFRETLTWEGRAENIRVPYLCVAGEADELSPLVHTERLVATLRGPKRLVVYQDCRHSVGNVPATNLGPTPAVMVADWMHARLQGKPFASERWFVEASGRVVKTPY